MNEHPICGFWPTRNRIAASILDGDGHLCRIWMAPLNESEALDCIYCLERDFGLDLRLIIPEGAEPLEAVVWAAREREMPVLLAPATLIKAIGLVAFARIRPRHCATMLARLPGSCFHRYVRTLPSRDPRQLQLL
jgi:hypothetical protein